MRGYWNCKSPNYASRNLNIDTVVVVPGSPVAILAAKARIEGLVRHRLGGKVASMLHYGVSPARPESGKHLVRSWEYFDRVQRTNNRNGLWIFLEGRKFHITSTDLKRLLKHKTKWVPLCEITVGKEGWQYLRQL